jgi:hypothetical protein
MNRIEVPLLDPPKDGSASARRRGARLKLRRRVASASGAVALTCALFAVLGPGSPGIDSLRETNRPAAPSPAATRLGTDRQLPPSVPNAVSGATPLASERAVEGTGPRGVGSVGALPSPTPAPGPTGRRAGTNRPGVSRQQFSGTQEPHACDSGPLTQAPQDPWCLDATVTDDGSDVVMMARVCRNYAAGAGELTFASTKEVDFKISQEGVSRWQWSSGQRFPSDHHTLSFTTGGCINWTVRWNAVLDSGRRLPAGAYTLSVTSAAAETTSLAAQVDLQHH